MKPIFFLSISFAAALQGQTVLVKPYVQPGDGSTLGAVDVKVLTWVTDAKPGKFTVEYAPKGQAMKTVVPVASGFIAGESLMGILIALLIVMGVLAK